MNGAKQDIGVVVSVLLALPIFAVWAFALLDIARRPDIRVIRKVVYGAIVILVFPATLLYLLARPTSIVRHHERTRDDWRDDLVDRLEMRPGGPPVVSRSQEQLMLDRVEQLHG